VGALLVLVAAQLSVLGLYRPPVFKPLVPPLYPPQTIISLPVHTAVCWYRAAGALLVLVGVHVSSMHIGASSEILPELWGPKKANNVPAETIRK
jgi:hypothetical protein